MIRSPPTSIALSASDVSTHLRYLDVYHGLLKQGFKKKDIDRYFREHREVADQATVPKSSYTSAQAHDPAGLEPRGIIPDVVRARPAAKHINGEIDETNIRKLQNVFPTQGHIRPQLAKPDSLTRNATSSSRLNSRKEFFSKETFAATDVDITARPQHRQQNTGGDEFIKLHVPRKSSLLRFADVVSSDEKNDDQEEENDEDEAQMGKYVPSSPRPHLTYKRRTEKYSYATSDADDRMSHCSSILTVFEGLVLDDSLVPSTLSRPRTYASEHETTGIMPCRLGSPAPILDNLTDKDPATMRGLLNELDTESSPVKTSRIVPMLRRRTSDRQSSSPDALQSSPPVSVYRSLHSGMLDASSPTLPSLRSTPRKQQRPHAARTEPRDNGSRYVDGPSFIPYNDSVPAGIQPQTPADLPRAPTIHQLNAAYTAPPGRLRTDGNSSTFDFDAFTAEGQQSPTNRAIQMRRRRNREFARSARIESLRIHRTRRRQQQHETRANGWEDEEQFNLWRDDLDADRAGEENFGDVEREPLDTDTVIRIVSGNRHVNEI